MKHNCNGNFEFIEDNGNENLLFAECVNCGYLNYATIAEL